MRPCTETHVVDPMNQLTCYMRQCIKKVRLQKKKRRMRTQKFDLQRLYSVCSGWMSNAHSLFRRQPLDL